MSTAATKPIMVGLAAAAEMCDVSVQTIRRAIKTSDPKSFPPPLRAKADSRGHYRILVSELERWAERWADA